MAHVAKPSASALADSVFFRKWNTLFHWIVWEEGWVKIGMAFMAVLLPYLTFFNLDVNPRPWHDEGSTLSLARTLAEDGVYAIRSTDGYQTFGAVQSVGPTVILPVALVYRLFGVGVVQGRIVSGVYLILALVLFFLVGKKMFGERVGLFATFFLLASPAVRIVMIGRQVLGEIPALAFFLAGWLVLEKAIANRNHRHALLAGLLFGLAIVTKSQYLVAMTGAFGILVLLDLFYCRQKSYSIFIITAGVSLACAAGWLAWQRLYYGPALFAENLAKLAQLSSVTNGFNPKNALTGIRAMLGIDMGHFYLYWGLPAMVYAAISCIRKEKRNQATAFLFLFMVIWLAYFLLWTIPWGRYGLPAMVVCLLFIGKLYDDLAVAFVHSMNLLKGKIVPMVRGKAKIPSYAVLAAGTLVAILTLGMWMGYNFQKMTRADVVDRQGGDPSENYRGKQFSSPWELASFMNETIPTSMVIETWERELHTITDHTYHFPDQIILADVDANLYAGQHYEYALGEAYFNAVDPAYLIIGYTARYDKIYNMEYVDKNFTLVKNFGHSGWEYALYERKDLHTGR